MTHLYPALISAEEAMKRLQNNDAKFVDASMGGIPDVSIANAVYFDIDDICDPDHPQPHMIPSAEVFAKKVGALGISNDDEIIIFDYHGMAFAAARAWWLFRLFGHEKVSILDGGFPAFIRAGGEKTGTNTNPEKADFSAKYNPSLVKKIEEIKANLTEAKFQLVDARDEKRFKGAVSDPIHQVPSGHIPQSCNLFFMDLIDHNSSCLHTNEILEAKINTLNLDMTRPIAVTCGSGVTACILALAFYQLGYPDIAVYDGSWSEWSISGEAIETEAETSPSKNQLSQSITTKLSHAGSAPQQFSGLVNPPVHRASTIIFDTYKDFQACFEAPYRYGREATPTSDAFTDAIAALDGAFGAIATPSGLSAINSAVMAFVQQGDHILVPDNVYGFARVFFDDTLAKMGVSTTYYDPMEAISRLEGRITDQTKLIYLEAPGSITYEVPDLEAIIALAKQYNLKTMIDNSWATPIHLRPLSLGVDVSIMSATKYINGHSDIMLGVCSCRDKETFQQLRFFTRQMGICAGSEELYLGLRGLRTLDVRLRQHAQNGMRLARWLQDHPAVKEVRHPALSSCPGHKNWQKTFDGYSGVFAIILKETDAEKISQCLNKFKLFKMGFSWGGYESLIFPEQPTAARSVTPWDPEAGFILRIHAGLEDIDELHADIEQALSILG